MAKKSQYQAERIRDPQTGKRIANPLWTKETADPRVWNSKHPEDPIRMTTTTNTNTTTASLKQEQAPTSPLKSPSGEQLQTGDTIAEQDTNASSSSEPTPPAPVRKRRDLNREKSPSSRKSSAGIATADVRAGEKDYKQFFEDGLPVFTWLIGMAIGLMMLKDVELGQSIFTMTGEEADALAGPLASLMNKQKIPARVKKVIISSNDGIAIIAALGVYGQRVLSTLNSEEVRQHVAIRNAQQKQAAANRSRRPGVTRGPVARPEAVATVGGNGNGHNGHLPDILPGFVGIGNIE